MNVDLSFYHYFKFLRTKTEIYNSSFNLINVDGLWVILLEIWLNHIEIYVIWGTFQLLLKLHSHFSVIWRFCRISVISEFSFSGVGLKTKTRKSRKISIFRSAKFKYSGPVFRPLF